MTCCAAGPCDRYQEAKRTLDVLQPLEEQRTRLQRACRLCWQGEQPQPTRRQAAERQPKKPDLPTKTRTDPTTRRRQRRGPAYVSPRAWVAPRL